MAVEGSHVKMEDCKTGAVRILERKKSRTRDNIKQRHAHAIPWPCMPFWYQQSHKVYLSASHLSVSLLASSHIVSFRWVRCSHLHT